MKNITGEQGYTLIIVLWGLVILSIILIGLLEEVSLETLITGNTLEEREREQTVRSAVIRGIELLKNDETPEYDTPEDEWADEIQGELNGIEYNVNIRDAGSKLNLNYTPSDILNQLEWYDDKLKEELPEDQLIPDIELVEEILGSNFEEAQQIFTVHSRFNINCDRLSGLEKLMEMEEISQKDNISENLKEIRAEDEINSLEADLIEKVDRLGFSDFDTLEPHLTVEGQLNLNFVSQEVLEPLLKYAADERWKKYVEEIEDYREEEEIKEIDDILEDLIADKEAREKLEPYFTTRSRIFAISVEVKDDREHTVLVEREKLEDEDDVQENFRVKILKW